MTKSEFSAFLRKLRRQAEDRGLKVCEYCNGVGHVRHPDSGILGPCEPCQESGFEPEEAKAA